MVMILSFVLGGFILAIAMERWNLHTRVALTIINLIGASTSKILLGFMVATGFLSMFVSNTAAVMIMIPIGLAIIKEAHDLQEANTNQKVFKSLKISSFSNWLCRYDWWLGHIDWNPAINYFKRTIYATFWT